MKRFGLLAVVIGLLTGCEARVQLIGTSKAKELVSKMTYVKDPKTGICYSVISTGQISEATDSALSYSYVPCELVPPDLLKK